MLEDHQTNMDVFDKLVGTKDGLMRCQFEIVRSDRTRGDAKAQP